MESRFNLITEPWIPVVDVGRVSLRDIFTDHSHRAIGGATVQKIAITKLLLAIVQAAWTPEGDEAWTSMTTETLANVCLQYLARFHDRFFLYGERPFLQLPAIQAAKVQHYGAVQPEVSSGNTTVLTQGQADCPLGDSDRALVLLTLMSFALGGKKTDNSVVLTPGYAGKVNDKGKPSTGKPGPAVAHMGLLHTMLVGRNVLETLKINTLTKQDIEGAKRFPGGVGEPPWESMPDGEDCRNAKALKITLMGRLVPLSRFCLLTEEGLHYSDGIAHANYKDGVCDPTVAVKWEGKDPKALWVNPEKRPWRELTSLMTFLGQNRANGFDCLQLSACFPRASKTCEEFAIWSGGLRVSSNAGEQYVSGSDDSVESIVWLHRDAMDSFWFANLQSEMDGIDQLAKALYGKVVAYYKCQLADGASLAAQATQLFWQRCERSIQQLLESCEGSEDAKNRRVALRQILGGNSEIAYDRYCPKSTARQLDAWARCRPNYAKYFSQEA